MFGDDGGVRNVIDIAVAYLGEMILRGRVGLMYERQYGFEILLPFYFIMIAVCVEQLE